MCLRLIAVGLAVLLGCSDFECPDGASRLSGSCASLDDGLVDPEPKTRSLGLACKTNLPRVEGGWSLLAWELTVDPTPIQSGEEFAAKFEAISTFSEYFLNVANSTVDRGVSRVEVRDLHATVRVRRGALDPIAVMLAIEPIAKTCRFDEDGGDGPLVESFPTCSELNDNADGSNDDCLGLGGEPDPNNPCGQFVDIPISTDCSPGGVCDSLGQRWPNVASAPSMCESNGFCVTGGLDLPMTGSWDGYRAADSGYLLFGWDDADTGATIDQTNGPNHGAWVLPPAVFDEEGGPNSMRFVVGGIPIAFECVMGVAAWGHFGVGARDDRPSPAPDHTLIAFPIQEL